jgi:hypothetical protein
MKALALWLVWPVLLLCGLWALSPLAAATVPPAVGTVSTGLAGCLIALVPWLGAAGVLLAGGVAWRVSHPAPRRDVFLYPVEPAAPALPEPLEGTYRYE